MATSIKFLSAGLLLAFLAACGGGDPEPEPPPDPRPPVCKQNPAACA